MLHRLILSKIDRFRLIAMLRKWNRAPLVYLRAELASKLARATVYHPAQIPPAVITMNSRALLSSEHWGTRECSLVYPEDANCLQDHVSVLSPLGVQLLGALEGTMIQVSNAIRSFEVCLVGLTYQPEAHKHWHR